MTQGLLDLLAPDIKDRKRLEVAVGLARCLAGHEKGAQPSLVGLPDLDVARAEVEYEVEVRRVALEWTTDLFHLHLASITRSPESPRGSGLEPWPVPVPVPVPRGSARTVWLALLELEGRGLDLALPSLPEPGEPAGLVAARLVAAATCLGLDPGGQRLWRAHLEAAELGPKAGARAYREVLELDELAFELREAAHFGCVGCLLTSGALARARDWAELHMDVAAASPRLMRLFGWIALALGDEAAAEEYLTPVPRASLPAPLVALGDRLPHLRERLVGPSDWDTKAAVEPSSWTGLRRSDVGAAVLCVVQLEAGRPRVSHAELAPGIRNLGQAWLERQDVAPFEEGEPEWHVLLDHELFVGFPETSGDAAERRLARGCLSPRCRGLALVPLFEVGEVGEASERPRVLAGWLRLEFEHLLVPEDGRLLRLAAAVGRSLGLGAARPIVPISFCPRAPELFHAALAGLPLGRRRWWGVALTAGRLEVLASEGAALDDWAEQAGTHRWLADCLRAAQPFVQGAEVGVGFHKASRSGFAIPLGALLGPSRFALVAESRRAGDLGRAQAREWSIGFLQGLGERLEAAVFDAAHQRVHGEELRLPWRVPAALPAPLAPGLLGAGVPWAALERLGTGPVLVAGPKGSGKRTIGRVRSFLASSRPLELRARGLSREELARLLHGEAATLCDVEELPEPLQLELLRAIEAGQAGGLTLTSRRVPGDLGLWSPLDECLQARSLRLPGLECRRAELPGLFGVGLRRAARRQSCLPPHLTETAEALVWRQPWSGGLHELFDLARRIVPLAHGRELDAGELQTLAGGLGWQLLEKLPTRGLGMRDLWQALEGTRKKCGSVHRGHAARLLGWDPDTLSARLAELGPI